ncbi:uncharacterized protein LOC144453478 [Glandiceps talaboti]
MSIGSSCSGSSSTSKRSFGSSGISDCEVDELLRSMDMSFYETQLDYASPLAKRNKKARLDSDLSVTGSGERVTGSSPDKPTSCRCKTSCINIRCRCHKDGKMCGSSCKCTDCRNPMNLLGVMTEFGVDVDKCKEDPCLMQFLTRVSDESLRKLLDTDKELYCCDTTVKLHECIPGLIRCPGDDCDEVYAYSWCDYVMREMSSGERRNHCRKCRTCVGRCESHCNKCHHCCMAPCDCHTKPPYQNAGESD